ncbi:unnamed protein product, partial [Closterium sp. NIES-54]
PVAYPHRDDHTLHRVVPLHLTHHPCPSTPPPPPSSLTSSSPPPPSDVPLSKEGEAGKI